MNDFDKVKKIVNLEIEDDLLIAILFEMSRFYDSQLTKEYKAIQKEKGIILSTPERKVLRKKYYYGHLFSIDTNIDITRATYKKEDIELVFSDSLKRLKKYDSEKIINSMKQRIDNLNDKVKTDANVFKWLSSYNERRQNKLYSFCAFVMNQEKFEQNNYNENIIIEFIRKTYDGLENYRYFAIVLNGEIYNRKHECITWNLLYKAGIYAENFVQFKEKFFPFKKDKQTKVLRAFLDSRGLTDAEQLAKDFYSSISTGYKFEDCYVSDNQDCKILIYKKIELDESPVPCPSCNTTIQRGNSYPELFLRSYECSNPSCPDRSKSGRGKRFDEYGTYRYFKLVENKKENKIDEQTYQNWRRDIFNHQLNWLDLLLNEYVFCGEKAFISDATEEESLGRKIINLNIENLRIKDNTVSTYNDLPIVKLFYSISNVYTIKQGEKELNKSIEIINGNSSDVLQTLRPGQIGTAITSPPYYNAREYSQWPNMILYYIDMLINCKAVYGSLVDGGYYLYNIGDIVSEDNVYVVSNMSKRRLQLGFLSCMIFELAGYNLTGNILWDKGEVQSKRNSTTNLATGYVKCINCYEHLFVFRKGKYQKLSNAVERITPVIKINSKGENTYEHTAPYPNELVELVRPYVDKEHYVLDPFLGSGTTLKWCKQHSYKGIGIEIDETYYRLSLKNINQADEPEQLELKF